MTAVTVNQGLDKLLSKYNSNELHTNQCLSKWRGILLRWKMTFGGNYKLPDPEKVNKVIDTGTEID